MKLSFWKSTSLNTRLLLLFAVGLLIFFGVASGAYYYYYYFESKQPVQESSPFAPCDLNKDKTCNTEDLKLFAKSLGNCRGEEGYNFDADVDGDGCVTFTDMRVQEFCSDYKIHAIYICDNNYIRIVSALLGGGSKYIKTDGSTVTCPVVSLDYTSEECKRLLNENCSQEVCGSSAGNKGKQNFPSVTVNTSNGRCRTDETSRGRLVQDNAEINFSGVVADAATPCDQLEASLSMENEEINILIENVGHDKICTTCIGAVDFSGEVSGLERGAYTVRLISKNQNREKLLASKKITIP